ncbi:hypothetical protein CEXT_135831 [Caerostris extrusa]|nr:hypothetical protein CEXT_135831 [Caerostris extrusa]
MQKLTVVIVLMLLVNLVISFETEAENTELSERADPNCRKEGQSCDSGRKCCPGFGCNRLVIGLGYMGSIRCAKLRPRKS